MTEIPDKQKAQWRSHVSFTTLKTLVTTVPLLVVICSIPSFAQQEPHVETLADKVAAEERFDARSDARRAEAEAKKVEADRLSAVSKAKGWLDELKPLPSGGWVFRTTSPDFSSVTYSSTHQRRRVADVATTWWRHEYRDRSVQAGFEYLGSLEKLEFDCAGIRMKTLSYVLYEERNLSGRSLSKDFDPKVSQWQAVAPGTQGEFMLALACASAR